MCTVKWLATDISTQKFMRAYHHGVDTRVDLDKHPDGRGHVTHASPHGQHGTGVVVLLEGGATLALDQNDDGVENLVELGEVEPPAPEGKALVPHPADIGRVWEAIGANRDVGVPAAPAVCIGIIGDCVTKASWTLDLTERIDSAHNGVRFPPIREGGLQTEKHGVAGEARVDSKEDVMGDDEGLEPAVAGNPPRLVAMLAVVPVEIGDRCGVDGGNGQGDLGIERLLEDILGDLERIRECRCAAVGIRDGRRCSVWRKPQDGPCRNLPRKERRACARHCDVAICFSVN
jgi:hypothetical protein